MTTLDGQGASVARMRTRHVVSVMISVAAFFVTAITAERAVAEPSSSDGAEAGAASRGGRDRTESGEEDRARRHAGQFSLRAALVAAERIISRYDDSPTCGLAASSSEPKKFCGFGAPLALDLALGFAPFSSVEPFVWARFGLTAENTTHTKPLVVLGAGARLYTASDSAFKFFLQPAVGWELESGTGPRPYDGKQYKKDFLIQLLAGPQYDFTNNLGAFAAFGVTAGMLRAIQTWLEVDIGVQARF